VTTGADPRPPLDRAVLAEHGVEVLDEAGSTNALVAERVRAGAAEGLVVVAEHQVAGRGRLDRTWVTPARSSLTFSVLLRPHVPARRWPWIPLLGGYAVAQACREAGVDAALKWPNDVMAGYRKLCGILAERIDDAAVLGIGINVSQAREELPVEAATSLALETGGPVDRTALLVSLLGTLRREYAAWQSGDGSELAAAYGRMCTTVGHEVRVELPGGAPRGSVTGRASGIDADGRLVLDSGGERLAVGAGDVVHVRPAE
jgi:BirA family transcriptional regulator, biotin operon repressor / biotin---[acetyl-CoA-carboxylase] ligase